MPPKRKAFTKRIVKGYAYVELFKKRYPGIRLIEVENVTTGLKEVARGELFGFIDNLTTLGYLVQQEYVGTLKISAKFDENLELGYGVQKNQPQLRSILDIAILSIDERTKEVIKNRWTSIKIENGIRQATLAKILLAGILVVLFIYYRYRRIHAERNAMEALSNMDPLTDLFNRRKIDRLIDDESKRVRSRGRFSLILIDIDNFKTINDTYGHDVGDIALKHIAQLLKNSIRKQDSAGRWGGEEFLVICPDTTVDEAAKFAERIRASIENERFEKVLNVTASFGVAEYNSENIGNLPLIKRLDEALYESKRSGKNRVTAAKK